MAGIRKTMCSAVLFVVAMAGLASTRAAAEAGTQREQVAPAARVLVGEIGFRNARTDYLKKTYQYPWLYPQSFTIDAGAHELFVMLGARSGQNKWGWVQVYDLDSLTLKTTFSTRQHWHEGMVIRRSGTRRFLYTIGDASLIRIDITTLPDDLSNVEVEGLPVRAYSLLASNGTQFAVQDRPGSEGPMGPQRFILYDEKLRRFGSLTLTLDEAKKSRSVPEGGAKLQGIAWAGDRFYGGYGAGYIPGSQKDIDDKWQGTAVFDRSGKLLASTITDPDSMVAMLQRAIGYRPTCVENEGLAVVGNAIYSIWITLGPKEREAEANAGKGIVLMREAFGAGANFRGDR